MMFLTLFGFWFVCCNLFDGLSSIVDWIGGELVC